MVVTGNTKPVWTLTVNAHEEIMAHVVKHYADNRLAIRRPINVNKNFTPWKAPTTLRS